MSELNPSPPADHRVKIPHLVFGLLFLGAAAVWALVSGDVITEDRLPALVPALLVAAGVIGLAVSLASSRNRNRRQDELQRDAYPTHHDQDRVETETASYETAPAETAPEEVGPDEHTQEIR